MADPSSYGNNPDRDVEQAIVALKKGTQLIKYSRKGKPKFCPFRISGDEASIIWFSRGEERNLELSRVQRIVPGQRTAVFRRYLRPEKDYLSFSLIYNNGERSLDLICKDKTEADLWFAGLKELIPSGQQQQRNRRTKSDFFEQQDVNESFPIGSPLRASFDFASIANGRISLDSSISSSQPSHLSGPDASSDRPSMQLRTTATDGYRISVSSTPSCSSGGSGGPDDIEALGDVYLWGEVWLDHPAAAAADPSNDNSSSLSPGPASSAPAASHPVKSDVLAPRLLESHVVLDVHQISCGVRHLALVTRQGEVFTWGEESGGRLGHGVDRDFSRPRLVEFLAVSHVDSIACGEFHSCAVTSAGELFTWGDGAHNAGLLGHGTDASHWIPKRVNGPLDGLQVASVACGTWHTAVATASGRLFTWGDGAFGALGHNDRRSASCPREVQLLSSLKTVKVACGVWHTAAIVEVAGQPGSSVSSRKLFTWGDGDRHRLGHGSKDTCLVPTCVSSLLDYNFHQLGCGHTFTVALTTSGHVFTMGATAHGQLGNPSADGKSPCLVQDKLVGEFVEEISCGAGHVAVLTSRSEVFTWGKGANGRLGHGDAEDRKAPTLVEALKDRNVKNISCGSNFTTSICIHKWVSGADQSVCSGCRQAFGFTRKRHNCYNCGLVHCHACSSKKAFRAALAPTPGKPHRVCDACYSKLKSGADFGGPGPGSGSGSVSGGGSVASYSRKATNVRRSVDSSREHSGRGEVRSSKILLSPAADSMRPRARSLDYPVANVTKSQQLRQGGPTSPRYGVGSARQQPRRPSPPRSATSVFSKSVMDNIKKSNELLTQELAKLHTQVKGLKHKCDAQDAEMQKLRKEVRSAALFAEGQSSKCRVAKEFVKSYTSQMKTITERLPPEDFETEFLKSLNERAEDFLESTHETPESSSPSSSPFQAGPDRDQRHGGGSSQSRNAHKTKSRDEQRTSSARSSVDTPHRGALDSPSASGDEAHHHLEDGSKSHDHSAAPKGEKGREVIEQFEPGVYVTLILFQNGARVFRRVKFSKRRYSEHQAEEWWNTNKDRLLRHYSGPQRAGVGPTGSPGASSSPAISLIGSPSASSSSSPLAVGPAESPVLSSSAIGHTGSPGASPSEFSP